MNRLPLNKLKELIHSFSQVYFSEEGGDDFSFDRDIRQMVPRDRVMTMIKLLKFALPEMKSTDISIDTGRQSTPISQRMASLLLERPSSASQMTLEI